MTTGKIAFIVAHEGFQPIEYAVPKKILEDAGFTIITVSNKAGTAKASDGSTEVEVQKTIAEVSPRNYDGIFIIGGPGALENLDNENTYKLMKEANKRLLPIGAICASTRILAKAGILTRKRATGWNGDGELQKVYETYDVKYLAQPVVVEENIITADGPEAAETFGQEIINLIQNNKGWG